MLNQLLEKIGHHPTATSTTKITYRSPFNPQEKTPSFFVFPNSHGEWTNFKDFSSGNGGDIYKFLMEYYKIGFRDAKEKLHDLIGVEHKEHTQAIKINSPISSFNQPSTAKHNYKIKKVQALQNKALLAYLQERGISSETINNRMHSGILQEIHYQRGEHSFFSIAFLNVAGGYVTRNKHPNSKINLGKADITPLIHDTKQLKIFEGFIDYLSYIEIAPNAILSDYLILNSVSHTQRALELIQDRHELVELYLDNDKAGDEATEKVIKNILNCKVIDKRGHYKNFKDLNEYLLNR